MKIIKIPKRKPGEYRTIYIPNAEERKVCGQWLSFIEGVAQKNDPHGVMHGFMPRRSPVTNAMQHIGYQYTLCFDLADFFDTVTPEMLTPYLSFPPRELPECLFPDGAARQGLPTSPAIANLAAARLDAAIMRLNKPTRFGVPFVYTRYADDLSFSFNLRHVADMLLDRVPKAVAECGFKINPAKTTLQWAGAGYRHVTGIAVGKDAIRPTRKAKRRLRAAEHALLTGKLGKRTMRRLIASQLRLLRTSGIKHSLRWLVRAQVEGLKNWLTLTVPTGYDQGIKVVSTKPSVTSWGSSPKPSASAQVAQFGSYVRRLITGL